MFTGSQRWSRLSAIDEITIKDNFVKGRLEDVIYITMGDDSGIISRRLRGVLVDRFHQMHKLGIKSPISDEMNAQIAQKAVLKDVIRVSGLPHRDYVYADIEKFGQKTNIPNILAMNGVGLADLCSDLSVAPLPVNNRDVGLGINVSICKLVGNFTLKIDGEDAYDTIIVTYTGSSKSQSYLMTGSEEHIGSSIVRVGKCFGSAEHNKIGFDPLNIR